MQSPVSVFLFLAVMVSAVALGSALTAAAAAVESVGSHAKIGVSTQKKVASAKKPPKAGNATLHQHQRGSILEEAVTAYKEYDPSTLQSYIESIGAIPDFYDVYAARLRDRLLLAASQGKPSYVLRVPSNPMQKRAPRFYFQPTDLGYMDLLRWYQEPPTGLSADIPETTAYKDQVFHDVIYQIRDRWNGENDMQMTELAPLTFLFCWADCKKERETQ